MIKLRYFWYKYKLIFVCLLVLLGGGLLLKAANLYPHADSASNIATISASIDPKTVIDGTAPFDTDDVHDNTPGEDLNAHNGRVRSYDTVTYPLAISITTNTAKIPNPTSYVVEIKGYVDNGYTSSNGRTNAYVPAVNNSTDAPVNVDKINNRTTFDLFYTTTGSNFSYPLRMKVLGGFNGTQVTPHITVAVHQINNTTETDETTDSSIITNVPTETISSKTGILAQANASYTQITDHQTGYDDDMLTANGGFYFAPVDHNGTASYIGSALPQSVSATHDFTGSVTPSDLGPVDISKALKNAYPNFRDLLISNSGSAGLTGITGTPAQDFSKWGSGIRTTTITNIDSGLDDPTANTPANPNNHVLDYSGFYYLKNYYTLGGENNPNSINNTLSFASKADPVTYTDPTGTYNGTVSGNYNWIINNSTIQLPLFHYTQTLFGNNTIFKNTTSSWPDISNSAAWPYNQAANNNGTNTLVNNEWLNSVTKDGQSFNAVVPDQQFTYNVQLTTVNAAGSDASTDFPGGYTELVKFNSDAFTLSDADVAINTNYAKTKGFTTQWGISNNSVAALNEGSTMYKADLDAYTWYNSYADATSHGVVCAVRYDTNKDFNASGINGYAQLPVTLHAPALIGNQTKTGTPNNIVSQFYFYRGINQASPYFANNYDNATTQNDDYGTTDVFDSSNNFISAGSPARRYLTINVASSRMPLDEISPNNDPTFWGVGVKTADSNTPQQTMYLRSNNLFLDPTHPDTKRKITRSVTLPAGVNYVPDSTHIDESHPVIGGHTNVFWKSLPKFPEPFVSTDKTTGAETLTWTYELSYNDIKDFDVTTTDFAYPTISYDVTFDDYNWTYKADGTYDLIMPSPTLPVVEGDVANISQTSTTADNHATDSAEQNDALNRKLTVNSSSQPSVSNTLDPSTGYPDSAFTMTTLPYTTVAGGNNNLQGMIPIPTNKDSAKSLFSGSLTVSDLNVVTGGHTIDLYYSNDVSSLQDTNPIKINTSAGNAHGWQKYTATSDITNAKAFYYVIEGLLSNKDRSIQISMKLTPSGNRPGDVYVNHSYINSSDYPNSTVGNSSPYRTYTVVNNRFTGKIWSDSNWDGLYTPDSEPGLPGMHLALFQQNGTNWTLAPNYSAEGDSTGDTTASDGSYDLAAGAQGTYKVGLLKSDLDAKSLILTKLAVGADSATNSRFDSTELVSGYYLTKDTFTLPAATDITGNSYDFDNINGGAFNPLGNLQLRTSDLYFGHNSLSTYDQVYSNQSLPNSPTPPNNTVSVIDTRPYVYENYSVNVNVGSFHNITANNALGLQDAQLTYLADTAVDTVDVPLNQTTLLFSNTATTPGNFSRTYHDIQLKVPRRSSQNVINDGTYQANVTYSLVKGPQ